MTEQSHFGLHAVSISRLKEHAGKEVLVQGWLYNLRSKGKIHFLQVRDGSGIVQAVMGNQRRPGRGLRGRRQADAGVEPADQGHGARGRARPGRRRAQRDRDGGRAPGRGRLPDPAEGARRRLLDGEPPPVASARRRPWRSCGSATRSSRAIREFFHNEGFYCVDAPIFTPRRVRGHVDAVQVKYFDDFAYLTQSGQLYGEAAAMALGKVYVFGPTFRAERSKTRRHLTEFWMIEPEAAFYDLEDVMKLAESFVSFLVRRVLEARMEDLKTLERDVKKLEPAASTPYPRVTYHEAAKVILKKNVEFTVGDDFGAPQETAVSEDYDRPLMVHRWPSAVKAFYMKRDPDDPSIALGVDMIASEGYGEIIGGSQREDRLDLLLERIKQHELPLEAFPVVPRPEALRQRPARLWPSDGV
jgi:asparaginyl-tRNA synthetase